MLLLLLLLLLWLLLLLLLGSGGKQIGKALSTCSIYDTQRREGGGGDFKRLWQLSVRILLLHRRSRSSYREEYARHQTGYAAQHKPSSGKSALYCTRSGASED